MGLTGDEKRGGDDFTQDGTSNLKGKPILRSNTGKWRACYFMLGYEVCERMAYYGISTNLVLYLTRELHEGTVKSSNNVTNWVGTVWMTPISGYVFIDSCGFTAIPKATFLWKTLYIQDNVGWGLGYVISTLALFVAIIVFIIGTPTYRNKPMTESPFTNMVKVLVAAVRKRNVVIPVDLEELYELTLDEYSGYGKHRIDHSS
ncbi:hypothetical protein L1987_21982 [Smallanthus sonchifolius]|uniref:Uncharacterized protein n=1 Tax=Smallanthus sonchifolius TaxID=185202 RepID=A0ACB9IFD1_9ASTR|nr:hypothetical protein L1987_21982 [Smallanthus sonchifolius]